MDNFEKANLLAKQLMDEFTVNYMDKVFYFCLKKTDNSYEAEDLAADIMLSIVSALSRGTVPMYFSAWVWQIAKNRYSAWAKRRHYDREMLLEDGMEENEIMDGKAGLEEGVMQKESLLLLRRELAFISEDYRNIIVAYYLEKRKIAEIAASMGLSEEAVKSKLFRGRKRLKEGMDMAREFGVKSYQPEEVDFVSSGDQTNGLPWSAVQRRIPNNILLEANNNPSTMEELAIELGIALPYIEEEVGLLVDATLLKKVGSRYVTNFFIADKECQFAIRMELEKSAREYGKVLDQMVEDCLPKLREIVIAKNQMPDAELKMVGVFLYPESVDAISSGMGGFSAAKT